MADYDLTSLDELRPDGSVDQVLILDDAEHDTRRKLKAWADVEHSLVDGSHTFGAGSTPPTTPAPWQIWFNTGTNELLIYHETYAKWVTVEQTPYNYLYNAAFSRFADINSVPFGWSFYGTSTTGTVVPAGIGLSNTHQKFGPFALAVNSGNGDINPYQIIGKLGSTFAPAVYWLGRTVSLGCWVWTTTANRVRLIIDADGAESGDADGGATSAASAYHPGGGIWQWLVATLKVPLTGTLNFLTATLRVEAASVIAIFSAPTFVEGSWCVHVLSPERALRSELLHLGTANGVADTVPGGTVFYGPHGSASAPALAGTPVPYPALISNMRVYIANGAGSGKTYTCTLTVNGTLVPITCTIVDLNTFNVDNANKISVNPGDMLSLRVSGTAGANVSVVRSTFLVEELPLAIV
jgi:hypothetical protein